MFEINNLDKIVLDYTPLKLAIDESIKDNIFIRKGFNKNIYKLSNETLTHGISLLLKDSLRNYICIGINNIIEWTPIKLFQSAYFMIKIEDNFWIVERNHIKCFPVLIISMKDYMNRLLEISNTSGYLDNNYWATLDEFNNSLKCIKNDVAFIKQTVYNDNTLMNHFLYIYNNNYYYICVHYMKNHIIVYKPVLLHNWVDFNSNLV